ncbi:RNaseH [Ralstonia phage BOESR1]|uniref:RNaseH n=1 Tax=Ralstonia phage BOESR1 TaxID=3034917 RepID=A0AA50F2T0_9CAUD|nr:RNaseH [Ralstonia phage BOESR1]WLW40600.1 RNaseH [Ralstonia phage BOESR1]
MRIALIDADVTAFASAVVSEKPIDWGDGVWTLHADEDEGRRIFAESIDRIQTKVEADKVILAFSDSANWRKGVLPTYKSNRAGSRQPLIRKALTEWAKEEYETFVRPTLEGDDVLGILATMKRKGDDEYIICTIDKDLKTIPGLHYNIKHDKMFEVTEEEADRWHLMQTLMGDATDGYDGCPGIGPVSAKKILDKDPSWAAVVKAFDKAGLGEEEALVQARVARICRAEDYNFQTKTVKLWTPPKL